MLSRAIWAVGEAFGRHDQLDLLGAGEDLVGVSLLFEKAGVGLGSLVSSLSWCCAATSGVSTDASVFVLGFLRFGGMLWRGGCLSSASLREASRLVDIACRQMPRADWPERDVTCGLRHALYTSRTRLLHFFTHKATSHIISQHIHQLDNSNEQHVRNHSPRHATVSWPLHRQGRAHSRQSQ